MSSDQTDIPLSLAGRTRLHTQNWQAITSEPWVLETTAGYQLELLSIPRQSHPPVTVVAREKMALIDKEVEKLRQKGAVVQVQSKQDKGFFSTLFLVPKKVSGEMKPVVNLRPLNRFLPHVHFKMEGLNVVRDLIQENDWMCRIDLKDAYFAILCEQHQPLLRFY